LSTLRAKPAARAELSPQALVWRIASRIFAD
jgi:hypothetical protein